MQSRQELPDGTPTNKSPTGILGLDEIAGGGLPAGRTTLLVGGPGSGKTILALQFLAHGAQDCHEPGIFVALEESSNRLIENARRFNWNHSSLSYLQKFPVDVLKIDQSIIRQIENACEDATIVTSVIGMARNLGLRVIAEGVETSAQLAFLRMHQCDEAQGYYFSRPVPAEQFAEPLGTGIAQAHPIISEPPFSHMQTAMSFGRPVQTPMEQLTTAMLDKLDPPAAKAENLSDGLYSAMCPIAEVQVLDQAAGE